MFRRPDRLRIYAIFTYRYFIHSSELGCGAGGIRRRASWLFIQNIGVTLRPSQPAGLLQGLTVAHRRSRSSDLGRARTAGECGAEFVPW